MSLCIRYPHVQVVDFFRMSLVEGSRLTHLQGVQQDLLRRHNEADAVIAPVDSVQLLIGDAFQEEIRDVEVTQVLDYALLMVHKLKVLQIVRIYTSRDPVVNLVVEVADF